MALKANPNYKPDEKEVHMFFTDTWKSGWTNLKGMMIDVKREYPTLTDKEIKQYMLHWINENKIPIKR